MKIKIMGKTIHISEGNSKLGKTLNWSLMPGWTCSSEACCTCWRQGCYARSIVERRKNVNKAWQENTNFMYLCDNELGYTSFTQTINKVVQKRKPKWFRVHVGGDFFSREYVKAWCDIAKCNPSCSFFAFTKQWDYIKGIAMPSNLHIIASHWTGCSIPSWTKRRFPVAWLVENGKPVPVRKNRTTNVCKGDCTKCHWCNHLTKQIGDVAFMKHR